MCSGKNGWRRLTQLHQEYHRTHIACHTVFPLSIFWNVTPCGLANRYQYFKGTSCLHLQGRKIPASLNIMSSHLRRLKFSLRDLQISYSITPLKPSNIPTFKTSAPTSARIILIYLRVCVWLLTGFCNRQNNLLSVQSGICVLVKTD